MGNKSQVSKAKTNSIKKEKKRLTRYDRMRDELITWPYTVHQIRDTLDVQLIEARGKQLLFQAVNSENLTAFVGSGVSAAYGRHSWSSWNDAQLGIVEKHANAFIELSEHALKLLEWQNHLTDRSVEYDPKTCKLHQLATLVDPDGQGYPFDKHKKRKINRWLTNRYEVLHYAHEEVKGLRQTFQRGKSEGDFPGGERLPILFEIAQQLHEMLRSHSTLFVDHKNPLLATSQEKCRLGIWCDTQTTTAPYAEIEEFLEVRDKAFGHKDFHKRFGRRSDPTDTHPIYKVDDHQAFERALNAYLSIAVKKSSGMAFADLTKLLLVDEGAHADHILTSAMHFGQEFGREEVEKRKSLPKVNKAIQKTHEKFFAEQERIFDERSENLKRDISGIRQDARLYKSLSPFLLSSVEAVTEKTIAYLNSLEPDHTFTTNWIAICEAIRDHSRNVSKNPNRTILSPSLRFSVGAFLNLHENPYETFTSEEGPTDWTKSDPLGGIFKELDRNDFKSRGSIVADHLDPIRKLALDLKINRFLTTNYDFEIERFFQDIGFERQLRTQDRVPHQVNTAAPKMEHDDPRTGRLGQVMRDMTFRRENASELFRFSAGADALDVAIYHLHGRATEKGDIVVTERDYMDLYLREDNDRDIVDEGIKLAFSANPILFLGLGMTEADVLRPLRQFMSNHDRAIPHRSVVLMPAEKDKDARAKTSAGLYLRYGTHTIFYGDGTITVDGKSYAVDWLYKILTMIKKLKKITEEDLRFLQGKAKKEDKKRDPEDVVNDLRDALKTLTDAGGGQKRDVLALLLGTDVEITDSTSDFKFQDHYPDPEDWKLVSCELHIGPERTDGRRVNAKTEIDLYFKPTLDLLSEALKLVVFRRPRQGVEPKNALPDIREMQARVSLLEGLIGAFVNDAFNATLDGITQGWHLWWKQWQQSPPHRLARFDELDQRGGSILESGFFPRRFVRHFILSSITNLEDAENVTELQIGSGETQKRIETGVRAFDTFIDAIDHSLKDPVGSGLALSVDQPNLFQGRRAYTVAAYRGLGKGSFVSAFSSKLGLASYIDAAWPEVSGDDQPIFVAACLVNLSFGTEIASIYDMLLDVFFQETIALRVAVHPNAVSRDGLQKLKEIHAVLEFNKVKTATFINQSMGNDNLFLNDQVPESGWKPLLNDAAGELCEEMKHLSRTNAFFYILEQFKDASKSFEEGPTVDSGKARQPRMMLLVQTAELLFYKGGLSKNREVDTILRYLLMSPEAATMPFDIVILGDEGALGKPWREGAHKKAIKAAKKKHRVAKEKNKAEWFSWKMPPVHFIDPDYITEDGKAVVHDRSLMSGLHKLKRRDGATTQPLAEISHHQIHLARPMRPEHLLVDNFPLLAIGLFVLELGSRCKEERPEDSSVEDAGKALAARLIEAREKRDETVDELWVGNTPPDPGPGKPLSIARRAAIEAALQACVPFIKSIIKTSEDSPNGSTLKPIGEFLKKNLPDPGNDVQDVLRILRERYDQPWSTAHSEWTAIRRTLRNNRFSFTIMMAAAQKLFLVHLPKEGAEWTHFRRGAKAAESFIRGIVAQINTVGHNQRESFVLREVLESSIPRSQIGEPHRDYMFQMLLLKHVAVIGAPVSCNILVRAPEVREYLDKVNSSDEISRRRQVARAMYALCDSGLAFRVTSHPRLKTVAQSPDARDKAEKSWPPELEFRYAVHRSVQTLVITNLGGRVAQPASVSSFGPTLYASMPSNLPRLRNDGYSFLYSLVQTLSQYPDQSHHVRVAAPFVFNSQDTSTQVQALRAALSTVRTAFSISVVSRLDQELSTAVDGREEVGFFELYKINLRWMIRKAWEFLPPADSTPSSMSKPQERHFENLNVLYRDEIVWLYNEVGLVCLVQGNLQDTVALLRHAIYLNRRIEGGSDGSPQHNRISLNLAICQIERGRLDSAVRRLARIELSERTNGATEGVHALARCYTGLINHLMGDRGIARTHYQFAEDCLRAIKDTRAMSIVLYHHANLLRDIGERKEGNAKMREAIGFAEAGGHEDVRKRLQLTDCYHRLYPPEVERRFQDIDALRRLKSIEDYARQFGCMNLMVDSLLIRAQVLIDQNEVATAGRLLTSAAGLAKRYSMNLRLNRVVTQYARLLYNRERIEPSIRLAKSSLAMAKRSSYRLEMQRIQALLDEIESSREKS